MNKQAFTSLLEYPEKVGTTETVDLRAILDEFPYFQSAHALYLKGLKTQESFTYNKTLKVVAAHTTDRSVLFDYITSPVFEQNAVSNQIKNQEVYLRSLVIHDLHDVSEQVITEELDKAEKILDPQLFVPGTTEDKLQLGKPLTFDKNEAHSFNEWLKLSSFQPIQRTPTMIENLEADKESVKEEDTTKIVEQSISKRRKQELIDSFIETNPKIEIKTPSATPSKNLAKANLLPEESLMTETLARVYIEQKNYKKAKQAYHILSLKYPEKSGFFADQIRAVEQLESDIKES